jgi:hypothetical protein
LPSRERKIFTLAVKNKQSRGEGAGKEEIIDPKKVILALDCGLNDLPRETAFGKMVTTVESTEIIHAEPSLPA